MIGTAWSLLPPIVAIALALKTKEVYSSLFIGIILGAVQYCISMGTGFDGFLVHLTNHTVGEGDDAKAYGLIHCLSDPWNVGILVFLVVLGSIVSLMNKAGGSAAFGRWASKHVHSKIGVQIATILLGILIFIDDYFNCLTVGSVMRPIAVRNGVTKEKLAYLIDSTAAPVCIISPISSWAAAVSGFVSGGENGLALFCKAIPFNFYAFFTILFMFGIVILGFDFKAMSKYDARLKEWYERTNGGKLDEVSDTKLQIVEHGVGAKQEEDSKNKGTVSDLVIPIIMLIIFCMVGMVYSGGFFDADNANYLNFVDSFAASNASVGLVIGSLAALILTIMMFTIRKTLPFDEAMSSLIKGFEAMVPAILILTLAWTLKSMTDSLGAAEYVSSVVASSASELQMLLPGIIFLVAGFLAFATGTSWGTFGILIPICIAVFPGADPLRIISISACMAGAVCGDHISPISDTTIMASAGAECKHVHHVSSQLPYALTVACVSFLTFVVAGFTHTLGMVTSAIISWIFGVAMLGFAGELGHVIVRRDGRQCGCGRKGCLETYCSATGVARTAREFLVARPEPSLLRDIPAEDIVSKDVFDAAVRGDKLAQDIFEYTGRILGEALADFIAFSSPEAIILFGGLAKSGDYIMKPIRKAIDDNILKIYEGKTKLLISELKDADAAVLGASALGWEVRE